MKRVRIIARKQIYKGATNKIHDDEGLKALDGYFEGNIWEVDDNFDETALREKLIDEFEKNNPDIINFEYELKILK